MSRAAEIAFTLLRLVVGSLLACHGAQKLFGVLGGEQHLHGLMLVAGIVEFGGGLLVALGLGARVAAFIASGEMASAYFMVHAPNGFWPILNHGELAVAYCFIMLFIAANGAGPYSVDAMLGRKRT